MTFIVVRQAIGVNDPGVPGHLGVRNAVTTLVREAVLPKGLSSLLSLVYTVSFADIGIFINLPENRVAGIQGQGRYRNPVRS